MKHPGAFTANCCCLPAGFVELKSFQVRVTFPTFNQGKTCKSEKATAVDMSPRSQHQQKADGVLLITPFKEV